MQNNKNIENLKGKPLANDFDDDFFTPSEKVWNNIEKKLPKKNSRPKLPIIIGSLLVLMVILFTYNVSNNAHENSSVSANQSVSKIEDNLSSVNIVDSGNTIGNVEEDPKSPTNQKVNEIGKVASNIEAYKNDIKSSDLTQKLSNHLEIKKSIELQKNKTSKFSRTNETDSNIDNSGWYAESQLPMINEKIISSKESNYSVKSDLSILENKISQNHLHAELAVNNEIAGNAILKENAELIFDFLPIIERNALNSLAIITNKIEDKIPLIEPSLKVTPSKLIGLSIVASPFVFNKPDVSDPLEGTIKSSIYNRELQVSFNGNYTLAKNLFLSISPGVRYDRLQTVYDLNIPYDYNTEKETETTKENYFSHSLPTDLGNIKTNMVVSRASNSPVEHNELIHIDFNVDYHLYSIVSPIGINYAFNTIDKGGYIGARYISQFSLIRNTKVTKYESSHSYVSGDNVSITKENNFTKYASSAELILGYRLPLSKSGIIDINASYQKNLSSFGRPFEINIGLGMYKRF